MKVSRLASETSFSMALGTSFELWFFKWLNQNGAASQRNPHGSEGSSVFLKQDVKLGLSVSQISVVFQNESLQNDIFFGLELFSTDHDIWATTEQAKDQNQSWFALDNKKSLSKTLGVLGFQIIFAWRQFSFVLYIFVIREEFRLFLPTILIYFRGLNI